MKSTHILAASIAALCVAQSAQAANVTVRISGSTAFRAAATNAIKNVLSSGNPSISYAGGSNFSGATFATFVGTLPAVAGTVTVKCSWNGSVDGIRDVSQGNNQAFLVDGVASSTGSGTSVAVGSATDLVVPDIAMADNTQASTIYKTPALTGNGTPVVGVVPFAFVKSRGALAGITNTGRQQVKWLLTNAFAPASLWTGNSADTQPIWPFGRDPFSGTRLTALAETTYGTTTPVTQFTRTAITGTGVAAAITTIDQTPDGGIVGGISLNGGNNGEASGGNLADNMRFLSSSVTDGYGLFANTSMGFITYLGENDANRAVWGLGSAIGWNSTNPASPDRAAFLSYEGVAGFAGEAKNAVAGTITLTNTLTISAAGPAADANHEGATAGAANLVVGQIVSGTGITPGSVITSITLPNIITLDKVQVNGAVTGLTISSFIPATVRNGSYPFWNYEQMLWKSGTPGVGIVGTAGDKFEVAKSVRDQIRTVTYGFSGLDVGSMTVQRFSDGGAISPISYP